MKVVRGTGRGVEVVDIAEPEGDGVLVQVRAAGICGSDLSYVRRGSRQIIGHELAGIAQDGTPVVVEGIFGCGTCDRCREGQFNLCDLAGTDILGLTVTGGMAEYFRAPPGSLVAVPDGLCVEDAALVEPGAVAWHACRSGGVGPGTRVAVVGAGAIGLLTVLAAQTLGAHETALEARYPHQIELGERLGATRPDGRYEVVIEASGSESGLALAIDLAAPSGAVVTIGVYPAGVSWPYRAAFLKEVRTVPSIGYRREGGVSDLARVASMLAGRPEAVEMLITHRFPLDEAVRAFSVAAARAEGAVKVVVHP
jgi:2-desacetyl-2-hydroxyethyl bacteriochlorophyllide A dehydrogenase